MNFGNCSVAQDANTNCYNALSGRQVRSVYLVSRAQADIIEVIVDTFKNADPKISNRVLQWVCSQERHRDGGIHYHMAVKLERNGRWLKIPNYVDEKDGVKINFSSNHAYYYFAWKYATKDDTDFVQSRKVIPTWEMLLKPKKPVALVRKAVEIRKRSRSVQEHPVCQYTTGHKSPSVKA